MRHASSPAQLSTVHKIVLHRPTHHNTLEKSQIAFRKHFSITSECFSVSLSDTICNVLAHLPSTLLKLRPPTVAIPTHHRSPSQFQVTQPLNPTFVLILGGWSEHSTYMVVCLHWTAKISINSTNASQCSREVVVILIAQFQLTFKAVETLTLLSTLLPLWNPRHPKREVFHYKTSFLSRRIQYMTV